MIRKQFVFWFFVVLALSDHAFAQTTNHVVGPDVTVQTDGTKTTGQVNIATENAGPIQFFTNKTRRGYIDGSTGVLTGFTLGSTTLTAPTINTPTVNGGTFTAPVINTPTVSGGSFATPLLTTPSITGATTYATTPALLSGAGTISLDPASDANRHFSFSAASDTALRLTFGDGTANATYSILGSTANGADTGRICIDPSSGACTYGRAAYLDLGGEQSGGYLLGSGVVGIELRTGTSDTSALVINNSQTAAFTGQITSSKTTNLGWTPVAGADTACNTTCTSACVFGLNLTAGNITGSILDCTDATADVCLCAGAS